jgi:signal transduction histidine kinase
MIAQYSHLEDCMTDPTPATSHSLAVQKQVADPAQQPLEVYHLSHDLRGPLNSILGFAELLLEGIEGPLNENQQADVAAIYQSAQNLLHLINTVVDLSKSEANRLNVDLKPVDLNEVLEAVLAGSIMEQPNFSPHLPAALPFVRGDGDRLEQMLKSLLKFAFKLTKKGAITLTVRNSDADEVTLCLDIEQTQLGQGEAADLFGLIVKVDPTGRTTLGRGGLDLPLVRYLAEQQQGRVWADSHSSGHLVIYLSLTLSDPPP